MKNINVKIKEFMEENVKWYDDVNFYQATGTYLKYLSNIPIKTIKDYKKERFGE